MRCHCQMRLPGGVQDRLLTLAAGCAILPSSMKDLEPSVTFHNDRRGLGRYGENLAAQHLAAAGYAILARNWRTAGGEIDLVVQDGETLVVVEVRTRRGRALGTPEESITPAKRSRLIDLGQAYVQATDWAGPWRIDVVAVEMDRRGRLLRVDHYENAVTG
jgi:putative endonuclease